MKRILFLYPNSNNIIISVPIESSLILDDIDLIIERYDSLELDLELSMLNQAFLLNKKGKYFRFLLDSLSDFKIEQSEILERNRFEEIKTLILNAQKFN